MAQMPKEVLNAIEKHDNFVIATCSDDKTPNVIYVKYLKAIDEETVLLADNYFNKTKDNILSNKQVAFAVLDDDKGSYQVKGTAERFESGDMYDEVQRWASDKLPRVAAVVVKVEAVYNGASKIA